MELAISFKDATTLHALPREDGSVIIGRRAGPSVPDIDLSQDVSVSRRHAKMSWEGDGFWVEDLGSTLGTFLNGSKVPANERVPVRPGDLVRVGKTSLCLQQAAQPTAEELPTLIGGRAVGEPHIRYSIEDANRDEIPLGSDGGKKLLKTLHEVAVSLSQRAAPMRVGQKLIARLLELVPAADHAALLLVDERASDLMLVAHEPQGDPRVSTSLAMLAMERREALVWIKERNGASVSIESSIAQQSLENVLCAPLIWDGRALGALWLSGTKAPFSHDDLHLVATVAQHAAMAVAEHKMRQQSEQDGVILKRLLAHFSPKVAARLVQQATHGRFRPGGQQSQVTLLCCDLRGFTKTSAAMPPDEVVDMLNEYFAELVAATVRHSGTVDKFIGDAVLAVFGSPEPDPDQFFNSILAAKEMQKAMAQINAGRALRRLPTLDLGVSVHCGTVLHGFIGSEDRMEFTVIGDAVNMTTRYCDGAGPGEIVISPDLYQIVWKRVKARKTEITSKRGEILPAFILID